MTDDCARVRAYADDKARINDLRQGDDTQADVVARLLDRYADAPDTDITATVTPEVDEDALANLTDRVDDAVADAGAGMTYDDVRQACRQALREELPVEEMGR